MPSKLYDSDNSPTEFHSSNEDSSLLGLESGKGRGPYSKPLKYPDSDGDDDSDLDEKEMVKPKKTRVGFLCIDMSSWSETSQFLALSFGVFLFFMLCSVMEEYTFKRLPEKFTHGMYLTLWELIAFSFFALLERRIVHNEASTEHNAPLSRHFMVGIAVTLSRGLTNVSLEYLNYPTQVIFKSAKLITVMLGSVAILGKRYGFLDWFAAMLLVMAAAFFSLGDIAVEPSFSHYGVLIVCLSLIADSVHSNTQDLVLNRHNATVSETMLFTNFFAAVCVLIMIVGDGSIWPAIEYCRRYQITYVLFIARAAVIYFGVLCFATLIKRFDVVVATVVTTIRKILTIVLSFLLFPKPFSIKYLYGGLVFSIGLFIQVYQKQSKK